MAARSDDIQMLMGEIKSGSVQAFDELYEQLVPFVFQIALKVTGDKKEAEDVCHDVFLEVYRNPFGYDPARGSVKAWLAVKTRSRSLDHLRKKRQLVVENPDEQGVPLFAKRVESTEDLVLSKMQREVLISAMAHIPDAQRRALQGKFFQSRTQLEIAHDMGRPVGTVKSLIRYGIRNVRKQLQQLGWVESSSGGDKHHES